jgi:hypothetical protein
MKTNYVIGETYYYKRVKLELIDIRITDAYPLRCFDKDGDCWCFLLDGKYTVNQNPSLSTSPTEFIAPKEKCETKIYFEQDVVDEIKKVFSKKLSQIGDKQIYIDYTPIDVTQAIALLKSEGYTITKQY